MAKPSAGAQAGGTEGTAGSEGSEGADGADGVEVLIARFNEVQLHTWGRASWATALHPLPPRCFGGCPAAVHAALVRCPSMSECAGPHT
jgi:hypothetical protein